MINKRWITLPVVYSRPFASKAVFLIGRRSNVVRSERGNQRDGLWLAHMDLAMYSSRSNTVGFWFSSRASSGPFGWIFDWKVREELWIFWPLCCEVWKRSDAILGEKIARRWNPFKTRFPPLSFYYKEQSTANSNLFKIAQKTAFEAKGRLYITGKVFQRLFIIDLYTELAIYGYRWGKR